MRHSGNNENIDKVYDHDMLSVPRDFLNCSTVQSLISGINFIRKIDSNHFEIMNVKIQGYVGGLLNLGLGSHKRGRIVSL